MYIPIANEAIARAISKTMHLLSRPAPVPGDVTEYACEWLVHPTTGEVVLRVESTLQPVAVTAANLPAVKDVIASLVSGGYVTAAYGAALAAYIQSHEGRTLDLATLFPPVKLTSALTHSEMEAAGWVEGLA